MEKVKKYLLPIYRFLLFFLLTAFVVTCSFLTFFHFMDLDDALLRKNAIFTFLNVLFLSFLLCVIDAVRRKFTVDRPVKRITNSLKKIKNGNFDEKIKPVPFDYGRFNPIIDDINLLTTELSGVETLRTDFISNVSHELKTPLSVIKNYALMLSNLDLTEEERTQYTSSISNAAERLSDLITNILRLNKLENQQIYPDIVSFNLSEQLCECMLSFEAQWDKKKLNISADIDDNVYVEGDKELLAVVWNNLLSNAVKFTDEGGDISLSLKVDNDKCIVEVSDNGCGISKETGAHIFEKFYQGDTSHAIQGNGLGLALVKRVIDITNSEIYVQSEEGKGSIFTVVLPNIEIKQGDTVI